MGYEFVCVLVSDQLQSHASKKLSSLEETLVPSKFLVLRFWKHLALPLRRFSLNLAGYSPTSGVVLS